MKPFRIHVPDSTLADLRWRLAATRYPDQIPGSGWDYGTDLTYLQELCAHWADAYDWRAAEARLNRWDQFVDDIDGQQVHFLHARSPEESAVPLLLLHGWPGSVVEFHKVLGPLSDPRSHGADPGDAFHVVAPSLPGYAFSGPTAEPGWDTRRIAETLAELMSRAGYDRFGAQGGDWGALVSTQLGLAVPDRLIALHLNMVVAGPPPGDDLSDLSDADQHALSDMAAFDRDGSGYARIQGTRPQTLSYGLNDSPAGLLAWIVEKFRAWSDCGGDVESVFTRDELLTNVMLYWVTGTTNSAARLYCETQRSGRFGLAEGRVEVPTGCAIFPKEMVRAPRRWAEHAYRVVQWSEMERGGHFAALEQPAVLVEDVRRLFRAFR